MKRSEMKSACTLLEANQINYNPRNHHNPEVKEKTGSITQGISIIIDVNTGTEQIQLEIHEPSNQRHEK